MEKMTDNKKGKDIKKKPTIPELLKKKNERD